MRRPERYSGVSGCVAEELSVPFARLPLFGPELPAAILQFRYAPTQTKDSYAPTQTKDNWGLARP